jgi:hypothetical protein
MPFHCNDPTLDRVIDQAEGGPTRPKPGRRSLFLKAVFVGRTLAGGPVVDVVESGVA